jgi:hypothetical protein
MARSAKAPIHVKGLDRCYGIAARDLLKDQKSAKDQQSSRDRRSPRQYIRHSLRFSVTWVKRHLAWRTFSS